MPMMRYEAKLAGGQGNAFAHLPPDPRKLSDRLADEGVSCTVCHQITDANFGKRESFVGGFKIDELAAAGERRVYGPFDIDKGQTTVMHSSSTFRPAEGKHIRASALCATCHTLITQALDAQGNVVGELPEQVPYQEWLHSDYKETRSCQSCHLPGGDHSMPAAFDLAHLRVNLAVLNGVGAEDVVDRFEAKQIGRALFEHALAQIKKLGHRTLRIEADPNAEGFYTRMGARRVGVTVTRIENQRRELPLLRYDLESEVK
jgi:GNAT superfamily N-acetyltransferase